MKMQKNLTVLSFVIISLSLAGAASAKMITPPKSFLHEVPGLDEIDHRCMDSVDVASLQAEESLPAERSVPFKVAQPMPTEIGLDEAGTWDLLPEGGAIWRMRVSSPGALFLSFLFSEFHLPAGAEIHFFSVDRDFHDGPYTHRDNKQDRRFGSPMIPGDSAVVELYTPSGADEVGLAIESVSYGYKDVMGMGAFPFREAEPGLSHEMSAPSPSPAWPPDFSCQRDINCPEGESYQVEKRAVAEGYNGSWLCSGTLINNVRQDNRYLYITAEHCKWWRNPSAVVYYWNYENSGCGTHDAPTHMVSVGSTELYHTTLPTRDLDLLELHGTDLETSFDVYFAGWYRGTTAPTMGATIGHPDDKPKQIQIENDPLVDCELYWCPSGYGPDFWRVLDWDVGVTEQGSSGGCLLNEDLLLVGVLSGGVGTDCTDFEWDEFGKLSSEWEYIHQYLDPDDTGAMSLAGKEGLTDCWDIDGDGFEDEACGGTDCDDTDSGTHPGAPDVPDGIDNDCDGFIDESCFISTAM